MSRRRCLGCDDTPDQPGSRSCVGGRDGYCGRCAEEVFSEAGNGLIASARTSALVLFLGSLMRWAQELTGRPPMG